LIFFDFLIAILLNSPSK